jgi:hypothetical protein
MPAARWKHVAAGIVPNPNYEHHGYSRRNVKRNRWAVAAMFERRALKARIEADIAAFTPPACDAALAVVLPGNPWRPLIERRAAEFTAHARLAWLADQAARASLSLAA